MDEISRGIATALFLGLILGDPADTRAGRDSQLLPGIPPACNGLLHETPAFRDCMRRHKQMQGETTIYPTAPEAAETPLPVPFAIDATLSDPNRPALPLGEPYVGPLFDTQAHLDQARRKPTISDASVVTTAMAEAHIERLVIMPTPNAGVEPNMDVTEEQWADLRRDSDGRVLIMCGSEYLGWWMNNAARAGQVPADTENQAARLDGDLATGRCIGAGEIGFRHYNKSGDAPIIALPAGYPPLIAIGEVTAARADWLALHAEPVEPDGTRHDAEVFGTIALMFQRTPNLRLRLSHTAMTNAHNARALLQTFPNLMMTIQPHAPEGMWANLESPTTADGRVYADWAALFEDMPDRFTIGTDFMFGRHNDEEAIDMYIRLARRTRLMLGSLTPKTVRMIAWENAVRVFGARPQD